MTHSIAFPILFYFLVILAFTRMKSMPIGGKVIFLFRAFFPSWKFFEDNGEVPHLFYRMKSKTEEWGPWKLYPEPLRLKFQNFFLNPEGNFALACGSLLQHLVDDIENEANSADTQIESTVPYRLTKNLVIDQVKKTKRIEAIFYYQFKISTELPSTPGNLSNIKAMDDLLLSPTYEV